jgi:hypothetical protein
MSITTNSFTEGRIPSQIKSACTNEWYEDMPPLPDHPFRRQSHLIDRDWDIKSQESYESISTIATPTATRHKRRQRERKRLTNIKHIIPQATFGPHQYPHAPRTPVNQRYHFIEMKPTVKQLYQRTSRQRTVRLTSAQIREAIDDQNVDPPKRALSPSIPIHSCHSCP